MAMSCTRLVRVDRGRFHQLARGVAHRHLHAGADAGVQPHHRTRAGGRGQQQVAQVVGEDLDGHLLGLLAQAGEQVALGGQAQLHAPRPRHALADQVVALAARVAPAQVQGDLSFGQAGLARLRLHGLHQLRFEDLQRTAAEHRQRPVRRHAADGLVVIEIVAELGDLGVVLVLAVHLLGAQEPFGPEPFAQRLHQRRVLGPALGEDVAYAVQHREGGREIGAGLAIVERGRRLAERLRFRVRVERGVGEQLVGQRLYAEFLGDLALGAALLLEGQVDVFQFLLGRRGGDLRAQSIGQLALLVDGLEHCGAAVFQLAQVGQARLQLAQLNVVQAARGLLAVARDEGHGGPAVQQLHGCTDLGFGDLDFCGQLPNDVLHVPGETKSRENAKRGSLPQGFSLESAVPMSALPFPLRTECPPGACVCEREALIQAPGGDVRILRLTREEEKRLVQRLENLASLEDLRRMEQRLFEQLGVRLTIGTSPNEVRSLRGITILVHEQPGLCRKTRQALPAAIRRSMEQRPQIAWDLLDEGGLFEGL
jgi:hypothetical protein